VQPCPLKGGIYTEVMEVCVDYDPVPIPQVETTIAGPTAKPMQLTHAKGEAEFKDLTPGGYTVSIKITGEKAGSYDFTEASSQDDVPANKRRVFYFEVPTHWVKVDAAFQTGQVARGLKYTLTHLAKPAWKPPSGTELTALQPVLEKPVPLGRYRLAIKSVWDARWNRPGGPGGEAARVVVGQPIELYAKTCGFTAGAKGQFEILDVCDLVGAQVLHRIEQAVSGEGDAQEIRTTWTPADNQLAKLKSGSLIFRAVLEEIRAFSVALPVFKPANFTFQDADSKPIETDAELVFSGGYVARGKSAGGSLDIEAPLGRPLRSLRLPLLGCAHVASSDGSSFNLP
jgi:hypothetical protein